jgi:Holliday junction resolvase RusA-like endonuclease
MTSKKITLWLPSAPVSASRPRFSKYGSYYSKSYMNYRDETHKFLKTIRKDYPIDETSLFKVDIEFLCYRPKKPSNPDCPRYDIDNLIKAPLDAITHEKMIWKDDVQILEVHASKRYQEDGEDFGTKLTITKVK